MIHIYMVHRRNVLAWKWLTWCGQCCRKRGNVMWGDAGGGADLARERSFLDHASADAPH
jgi:hypothetical protein